MHIHANQFDPNIQLSALYATEAKKEAERTRKKLLDSASSLAAEADCVVELSGDDPSQQQADSQDKQNHGGQKKQSEEASSENAEGPFSDWA